jgi:hypothetical protein
LLVHVPSLPIRFPSAAPRWPHDNDRGPPLWPSCACASSKFKLRHLAVTARLCTRVNGYGSLAVRPRNRSNVAPTSSKLDHEWHKRLGQDHDDGNRKAKHVDVSDGSNLNSWRGRKQCDPLRCSYRHQRCLQRLPRRQGSGGKPLLGLYSPGDGRIRHTSSTGS